MANATFIEEAPMTPTMALNIKRALSEVAIPIRNARDAVAIENALEAIIQGRHKVIATPAEEVPVAPA